MGLMGQVFVDTHRRRGHACYSPGDDRFFIVSSLIELTSYDEIYTDSSIFPSMWSDLRTLVHAGKRCFYLTRPWKWGEVRRRFADDLRRRFNAEKVKKTDFGDAFLLWKVYELSRIKGNTHKWFRPITVVDVELKPILVLERDLRRMKTRLEGRRSLGIDVGDEIKRIEKDLEGVRLRLIERSREVAPWMIEVARKVGVDSVAGVTGLIGVLTHLKTLSYHQAVKYLGLYKYRSKRPFEIRLKRCSGVAREYLVIIAESIHSNNGGTWPPKMRDLRQILWMVVNTVKVIKSESPLGGG